MTAAERGALARKVGDIRWYHTIDLGGGIVTPGIDASPVRLARFKLPSLEGRSVLDIGAWDGFFSFEAERRGAARVLATDSFAWSGQSWGSKAGFDLARATLGSKVESKAIDLLDLSPESVGTFDVVFCLGVLYHLKDPLLALERVAAVTKRCLILETVVDLLGYGRPAFAFYQGRELGNDPTNWWAPNIEGGRAILQAVGFSKIEVVTSVPRAPYRAARAIYHAIQRKNSIAHAFRQDRAVFHAYRDG